MSDIIKQIIDAPMGGRRKRIALKNFLQLTPYSRNYSFGLGSIAGKGWRWNESPQGFEYWWALNLLIHNVKFARDLSLSRI